MTVDVQPAREAAPVQRPSIRTIVTQALPERPNGRSGYHQRIVGAPVDGRVELLGHDPVTGERVGRIVLEFSSIGTVITWAMVFREYRGQGWGLALHAAAVDIYGPLLVEEYHSASERQALLALVRRGYVVERTEHEISIQGQRLPALRLRAAPPPAPPGYTCSWLSDRPTCTIEQGDASWHDGAGWYYVVDEYPDEGSCGAFDSRRAAAVHAEAAGYRVADGGASL